MEGPLTFHDDPAALFGHPRQIADELERIAKTLFGVQQERAASQRAPIPWRLCEVSLGGGEVFAFPAPLVFFPALPEISFQQQRHTQIEVGFRKARPEDDGLTTG